MRQHAHPVEGEAGPRGGKKWCNMDDVIQDFGLRIRASIRASEWGTEETRATFKEEWDKMTPAHKYERLLIMESSPESATSEPEAPTTDTDLEDDPRPVCGLCEKRVDNDDPGTPNHKACMDSEDERLTSGVPL